MVVKQGIRMAREPYAIERCMYGSGTSYGSKGYIKGGCHLPHPE
jgi:hypothetical protein